MSTYVGAYWDSLFQSSGRDFTDGASLFSTYGQLATENLSGGIWYGLGDDRQMEAVELDLELSQSFEGLRVAARYTHLRYPDHFRDSEIRTLLRLTDLVFGVEIGFENVYSVFENGTFQSIEITRSFDLHKKLTVTPWVEFGMNQGYNSDGHDGLNHVDFRLTAAYQINENCSTYVSGGYNLVLGRDSAAPGDRRLRNFLHFGTGIEWSY